MTLRPGLSLMVSGPTAFFSTTRRVCWDTAQQMRKRAPRRRPNGSDSHRLSGLVYCADCGARLSYHDCTGTRCRETTYDSDLGFQCSHYGNLHHDCTSHYIKASVLEAIILRAVQSVTHFAKEH